MPEGSAEWDPTPMPGWREEVSSWPWEVWNDGGGRPEGWLKSGPCPRCGHTMSAYSRSVNIGVAEDSAGNITARCNCEYPHKLRPDDIAGGCGQQAAIAGVK